MGIFDLFRKRKVATKGIGKSAPFVIGLDGRIYSAPAGQATHLALAGGAKEVLAAGQWVVSQGCVLAVTNESPTYQTSLPKMRNAIAHLAAIGLNLDGDGRGVLVIIYSKVDEAGNGIGGERYRVMRSPAGFDLIRES